VQTSSDGFYWNTSTSTTSTTMVLDTEIDETVFARVVALNEGGRSFTSEVVSGHRSADGSAAVLIVDAFDRFAIGQLFWAETTSRVGAVRRMVPDRINPQSIITPHARAVAEMGWPVDSASDEALSSLDLSKYAVIIWATGEESTVDETFSDVQQAEIRQYWQNGGRLFVSGAEVLWDLDSRGSSSDKEFASGVLGATLDRDDAETTTATGVGLAEGLDLSFPDETSPYPIEWPDVLETEFEAFATYPNTGIAGSIGNDVALLGFPFESIGSLSDRNELMRRLLTTLAPDYSPPVRIEDTGDSSDEVPTAGCACAHTSRALPSLLCLLLVPLLGWRRAQGHSM